LPAGTRRPLCRDHWRAARHRAAGAAAGAGADALLGQKIRQRNIFIYGISMAVAGMLLFNLGLTEGLVALGEQAGNNVPWAFSEHRETGAPPLYPFAWALP
jgi:hypothetical protein